MGGRVEGEKGDGKAEIDIWVEVRGKDGGRDRVEGELERKVKVKGRER